MSASSCGSFETLSRTLKMYLIPSIKVSVSVSFILISLWDSRIRTENADYKKLIINITPPWMKVENNCKQRLNKRECQKKILGNILKTNIEYIEKYRILEWYRTV